MLEYWNVGILAINRKDYSMTKAELQEQLEYTQAEYYSLLQQIEELKSIITEGNRETNEPHLTDESIDIYERYKELLKNKIEEITGEKIDFCYYSFY